MKFLKALFALIIVFSLVTPTLAAAVSLDQAKQTGQVGEQPDGFLGAVQNTPEIQVLVKDINQKRLAAYQDIAAKNGTTLQAVELLAGKKAIDATPLGQFILDSNNSWKKK